MLSSGATYNELLRQERRLDVSACTREVRIAILADAAVPQLAPLLRVLLAQQGVRAEVYLGEYDAIELEVSDASSGLYQAQPQIVVVLPCVNALRLKYYKQHAQRASFAAEVAARSEAIWETLSQRTAATVVQCNYVLPYERQFGNFDHKVPDSLLSVVSTLNTELVERSRSRANVLMADLDAVAAYAGRRHWFDERMWTMCKALCSFELLPAVAQTLADIVLSAQGRVVKCMVLDLDNTLWGGVVGDDGLEGIAIGPYGDGEPFQRLQFYLLELKRRGIVLAVCSKNDRNTALEPFRSHPEMVLREEDIAVFVANWDPKPDNIRTIRETLNIGLDSMVFIDDNPFERQLVRENLPEVIVPEMPEDPSDYVRAIAELNLFEVTSFSEEDKQRAELYRSNAQRESLKTTITDLNEYLRSLDMRGTLRRFDAFHLPRAQQLLQRSNQFNLTTQRHSVGECEAMMRDEQSWAPFYLRLTDRFGDNGLISVIILKHEPQELLIDSWVMSCRVLGRGVEQFVMNHVADYARRHGFASVRGVYLPTAKNSMVKEIFAQFGFHKERELEGGVTHWRLQVAEFQAREVHIAAT